MKEIPEKNGLNLYRLSENFHFKLALQSYVPITPIIIDSEIFEPEFNLRHTKLLFYAIVYVTDSLRQELPSLEGHLFTLYQSHISIHSQNSFYLDLTQVNCNNLLRIAPYNFFILFPYSP